MNNLEKNAAKEALKNVSYEMLEYANKDELANQVVRRGNFRPGISSLYSANNAGGYAYENAGGGRKR